MSNLEPIEQQILEVIKKENGRPVPPGIMIRLLEENYGVKGKQKIYQAIDKLIANGLITQLARNNKLILGYENAPMLMDQVQEGVLFIGSKNCGFIRLDSETRASYFVHSVNLKGAINGDRVRFAPLDKQGSRDLKDAAVIEVLRRAKTLYVGKYTYDGKNYSVFPDDPRLYVSVVLDKQHDELKPNDKIVFEIKEIDPAKNRATAAFVKKVAEQTDPGIEVKSIIYDLNIDIDFNADALAESEKLAFEPDHPKNALRKDLRGLNIVTIDPATSKDLDDAIYVEKLENGNHRLIVAIADVSHYVSLNSALDLDALSRSTSVYFIDQVIPMLPERLSNDLCSLNPHEDKFVLVSETEIDGNGKVVARNTYPATINSKRRFSYDEVNAFFSGADALEGDKPEIKAMLADAKELAKLLRKEKIARGHIEFETVEPIIVVENGYDPIDILVKPHGEAQTMIEDFMVCANESITQIAIKNKIPFIYRVHPKPSQRKLKIFTQEAKHLGFHTGTENFGDVKSSTIAGWLNRNKDNKRLNIVHILLLRAMGKASYSTENTHHFGLASQTYTHFTSPIRRYADLVVHRLLWMYLYDRDGYTDIQRQTVKDKLNEICERINENETRAVTCERSINSHMFCLYMAKRIGETYDGFVSFVTSYGMFVELDNTINGIVRVGNMMDDFYSYNEDEVALVGRRTNKKYATGDDVKVKVLQIDMHMRQINFTLV